MISFKTLFKYMWKEKIKSVNFLLLLQFAISIIGASWLALANSQYSSWDKWAQGLVMVSVTTPFVIIIYVFMSIYRNEKISSSQSWQLLPISGQKFYLANLFTAIVNGIYLVIGQIMMMLLVLIPLLFDNKFRSGVGMIWHQLMGEMNLIIKDTLPIFLLVLLLILLFTITLYVVVTTINFVSTYLVEQLSKNNTKILRFFLIVALVVLTFVIGVNVIDLLSKINLFSTNTLLELCQTNIIVIIIDGFFIGLNIWFFNKYHEGK